MDEISEKYGHDALKRARLLDQIPEEESED
jgi:hypothetical protein